MTESTIRVVDVGKRYVLFNDSPSLLAGALQLRGRTKRDTLWALRGINVEVGRGESIGVLGRNGSGKSTLLRLLAGVSRPTEGTVTVTGRVAPLISVGVGFHPEMTGRENVYVNGMILGLTRRQVADLFDEIVEFAEIEGFIDTPVKFYSSGMFVRLGFAVAVIADPDVLLVDEVLAVGDVAFQLKCYRRMEEIKERGATIVVVSHNLLAVRNLCDRAIVLHRGEQQLDGTTEDAISLLHDLLSASGTGLHGDQAADTDLCTVLGHRLLGPDGRETGHVATGGVVTLELTVRFEAEMTDPIFGVAIFSADGTAAYIESTPWEGSGTFVAGEVATFRVVTEARLATGSYQASLGVRSRTGAEVHRPAQPILFYVDGRLLVSGVVDLQSELVITRDGLEQQTPLADGAPDHGGHLGAVDGEGAR